MDFRSIYQHGFARVAACTGRVAIADPPVNAEMVLRSARECSDEGVAVALFPELTLTGYSIEDLVLQDAVLDDVESALATVVAGSADLLPLIVARRARCATATAIYNCAVVVHRGRVLGVVPKSYPPTYREFYEGRQLASGVGERGDDPRSAATTCRSARICCSPPTTCPGSSSTSRSARTCGSRSRRAPRRRSPARPCCSTCRAARSPSAGPRTASCCAGRRPRAAWPPTSTPRPARASRSTDLAWDGQTTIFENGVLLAETERFPDGDRRAVADIDLDLLLQERAAHGDVRRQPPRARGAHRRVPPDRLHARPARHRPRAAAHGGALPVRARRRRPAQPRLLRGLQHPGRRAAAAAARRSATRRS